MSKGHPCPPCGQQEVSIDCSLWFKEGRPRQCEVVYLAVRTKHGGSQVLKVFVVPHICDPVTSEAAVSCVKMYSHLSQLDLADVTTDKTMDVDLLISSDFYWEFVTGKTIQGSEGPVAIKTILGWVLSGPAGVHEQKKCAVSLMNACTHPTGRGYYQQRA